MIVTNRSAGIVGYAIPEIHVRRTFQPGDSLNIPKEELEKLKFQPGGLNLLINYLQVKPEDVEELSMKVEPEYHLDEAGVKNLMLNGSVDEFLDALDFAPEGIIEMFKDLSVKLPMTDYAKIEGLRKRTGFDAAAALRNQKSAEEKTADNAVKERRVVETEATAPKRRVEESKKSKYTVIG